MKQIWTQQTVWVILGKYGNKGLYSPAKFYSMKIRYVVSEITRNVRITGRCTEGTFPKRVT
jgi:hypothetical protein